MTHDARKPSPSRGLLLFLLGALVGANATYFVMTRIASDATNAATGRSTGRGADQPLPDPHGTASAPPETRPPPGVSMRGTRTSPGTSPTSTSPWPAVHQLLIPVQGIAAAQLSNTFNDARSAGRSHDAIDILAPAGTPVLAVADGHVEKLFNSKQGGLTLYEFNEDGTRAYYYAHLQRYADGLAEQQSITRGQVIGYVGATGNASPDAPHLHFAIFVLGPEKKWWKGVAVNPYPRLTGDMPIP